VKDAESSRGRILTAAARLFSEQGFKKVTVRDICSVARANVAGINYHFGNKLGLYQEVLQGAIDAMRETTASARRAGEGLPADMQLRRYLSVFIGRLLSGGPQIHRLIQREINDPTPALDRLVEEGVRPRIEYLAGLVAEITGLPRADERVMRCVFSIQAQSVSCVPNPIAARLGFVVTSARAEALANHIADFSLGGLRGFAGERAARKPRRPDARLRVGGSK
jgi:TetR/AcrR family transcriptional regulator, regulator of cefoperazone and chloramphenicol sensitivity